MRESSGDKATRIFWTENFVLYIQCHDYFSVLKIREKVREAIFTTIFFRQFMTL